MKHLTLTQKLYMAGWLLAAAILGTINAFPLMALEEASMEGDPASLRELRSKLSLLDSLTAANMRRLSDTERLQSFFTAYHSPKHSSPADTTSMAAAESTTAESILPRLTGVVQRVDRRGTPYYLAVLDGRVCSEKDEIRTLTVGPITVEGVVLLRAGMKWFLPSPQPYYTTDQGR